MALTIVPSCDRDAAERAATRPLEDRRVTVVGAGVGGIAAAVLCARAGARVTLLDRSAGHGGVDTGLLLQPNGLAVLYGLGLRERLARHGRRVSHLRVANAKDRTLLDAAVPHFADGLDHALVVRRSELVAALMDLAAGEPRLERHLDADVAEAAPDGSLTYNTPHGATATTSDLIVAADGLHSRVRRNSGIPATIGRTWWYARGFGPPMPHLTAMTEYWTKLGIFGVAPLDRETYFYAATHAGPIADTLRERDLGRFRSTWVDALPLAEPILSRLSRLEDMLIRQAVSIDCPRWSTGRIVLLGDAAHAMPPNLGQGANSALVDATVLTWELTQAVSQSEALRRYEARRRSATRVVQRLSARLGWLSHLTHPAMRWLRDGATRLLGSSLVGNVPMRMVEQSDPLWLRIATEEPGRPAIC